ncbi:MAG: MotA/TolQ/ExbB proton channel family protein [Desulfovibrio sp.]
MTELLPDTGIIAMLAGATIPVKAVIGLLITMSLVSWTIIFQKFFSIGAARRRVHKGLDSFTEASDLSSGLTLLGQQPKSPLTVISAQAVKEFRKVEEADIPWERKRVLMKESLRRMLRRGVSGEMARLSGALSFLATCANGAPFIGLFGTVWGIMNSFHSIGQAQSAALATVAPGISEALVATAIGLGVAIPATIAYNYFLGQLAVLETELVNFAGMFLNRVEREVAVSSTKKDKK